MTTFKEIDINEYKKLLDNMQHICKDIQKY